MKKPEEIRTCSPQRLGRKGDLYLGSHAANGQDIYIPKESFETNILIWGPPGQGKSRLLELFTDHCSRLGPTILLDRHGDSAQNRRNAYARIPAFANKVCYFDPSEKNFVFGFNPVNLNNDEIGKKTSHLIDAIACWMGQGIEQTPRLQRWLGCIFKPLLKQGLTFNEAVYLTTFTDNPIRQAILRESVDEITDDQWAWLNSLKSAVEKSTQMESSLNRLNNFVSGDLLRLTLATRNHAIDLNHVIDHDQTVLLDFSESACFSKAQGDLLSALFLHELISVLENRPREKRKPVYIIIDEYHTVASRSLSESLVANRKHGARWILAHQLPSQLRDIDKYIFNNTIGGCQTKICFGNMPWGELAEHIEPEFFAGEHSTTKIKNEISQTKVVNYLEQKRVIRSTSRARTSVSSWFEADSEGESVTTAETSGQVLTMGNFSSMTETPGNQILVDPTVSASEGLSESIAEQFSEMRAETKNRGHSSGSGGAEGETETEGKTIVPFLVPVFGRELSSRTYEPIDEQRYKYCVRLKKMLKQTCCIKLWSLPPLFVKIRNIRGHEPPAQVIDRFNQRMYAAHTCFAKRETIEAEVAERHQRLLKQTNSTKDSNSFFED